MKNSVIATALLLAAHLVASAPARSQVSIVCGNNWSDSIFRDHLSEAVAVVQGYYLDSSGTRMITIGPSWGVHAQVVQFPWATHEACPFELSVDMSDQIIVFTMGGQTLAFSSAVSPVEAIYFRMASGCDCMSRFSQLALDGTSLNCMMDASCADSPNAGQIGGAALLDGFLLSGTAFFACGASLLGGAEFEIMITGPTAVAVDKVSWTAIKELYH